MTGMRCDERMPRTFRIATPPLTEHLAPRMLGHDHQQEGFLFCSDRQKCSEPSNCPVENDAASNRSRRFALNVP